MSNYPRQDQIVYGIVCGGDSEDPDPTMSGGYRVYVPSQYGKNVKVEDLPFVRGLAQGNQEGVTRFNPPPERGTGVLAVKTQGQAGSGDLFVLGTVPGAISTGESTPGNFSIGSIIQNFMQHQTAINIPPNIKEQVEDGALIRKIVEKGGKHSNSLLAGIPESGALSALSGLGLPNLSSISTAINPSHNELTSELLSKMPGSNMSIGSIFDKLSTSQKSEISKSLPSNLNKSLGSITNLLQIIENKSSAGFMTNGRVDESTLLQNATELFKKVGSIGEIINVFQRLQFDKSLHGLDKLGDLNLIKDSPFGQITQILSPIKGLSSSVDSSSLESIKSLFGSNTSFPGALENINLFGSGSNSIVENIMKMGDSNQSGLKSLMDSVSNDSLGKNTLVQQFIDLRNI